MVSFRVCLNIFRSRLSVGLEENPSKQSSLFFKLSLFFIFSNFSFAASTYPPPHSRPQRSGKNSSWPPACKANGCVSHFIQRSSAGAHHRQDQEEDWARVWRRGGGGGVWWTGHHGTWWPRGNRFVIATCILNFAPDNSVFTWVSVFLKRQVKIIILSISLTKYFCIFFFFRCRKCSQGWRGWRRRRRRDWGRGWTWTYGRGRKHSCELSWWRGTTLRDLGQDSTSMVERRAVQVR